MGRLGLRGHRTRPPPGILLIGAAWAFVFIVSGCARPEPYVFRPSEFDRKTFARSASVPGLVQVCYTATAAPSDAVVRVAEEECAKYGKTPQMIGQDISVCPAATPISANYLCCPSTVDPNLRYRCSPGGGQVERLNNDQVREALAAERRKPTR
ncbi:MAG: hypothetical protein A3G73_07250 [Rhodospirillales bacterium RIFCSPLOWO2_12_FULL_67_15]|nr:MAG: hypothetical protein A3G73_07250 [Rhodospirillales bacterium RIFCSPLOWO2_12_FULL_67_15]